MQVVGDFFSEVVEGGAEVVQGAVFGEFTPKQGGQGRAGVRAWVQRQIHEQRQGFAGGETRERFAVQAKAEAAEEGKVKGHGGIDEKLTMTF